VDSDRGGRTEEHRHQQLGSERPDPSGTAGARWSAQLPDYAGRGARSSDPPRRLPVRAAKYASNAASRSLICPPLLGTGLDTPPSGKLVASAARACAWVRSRGSRPASTPDSRCPPPTSPTRAPIQRRPDDPIDPARPTAARSAPSGSWQELKQAWTRREAEVRPGQELTGSPDGSRLLLPGKRTVWSLAGWAWRAATAPRR
jgi:hypothetical protein